MRHIVIALLLLTFMALGKAQDIIAVEDGGGIHNSSSGEYKVLDTTIKNNKAKSGGGFTNASDSTLIMQRTLIISNVAKRPANAIEDPEDGGTARVNLRLPAHLKARAEEAASREGLSVNAWLVRAVSAAVATGGAAAPRPAEKVTTHGQSFTGWVR
jgi:predicted HicB family RNase H-like nuclease